MIASFAPHIFVAGIFTIIVVIVAYPDPDGDVIPQYRTGVRGLLAVGIALAGLGIALAYT